MIAVLAVIGTRPEAIKMGPVIRALAARPERVRTIVCLSGQHRELLDGALAPFRVVPDHDLAVMRPGQSLTDVTAAVLQGMEPLLAAERPDWVLVQGDTTTVLAAALAAFYAGVRVGHVEAGLRTGDKRQPFPEEINRRLSGVLADLHFAPTTGAARNLWREGVPTERVVVTGNTVVDAIRYVAALPFDPGGTPLAGLPFGCKRIVLVTAHRRENFGAPLEAICAALRELAGRFPDVEFAYPVHPNPQVVEPVTRLLGEVPGVTLLPSLDYRSLVWLMARCHLVITDSGGIQEEAPGLGKPVLVLRQTTERPEGVAAGVAQLVGTDPVRLVAAATRLLSDETAYEGMARAVNPYGDGTAAERIVAALLAADEEPVKDRRADAPLEA